MENLTIVKVGGAVVEDDTRLSVLLHGFSALPGYKILVHGGGRRATKIASQLGILTVMRDGRRVTDSATLTVVTMVYGGLVNKHVVALLQALNVNALGVTGADADIIRAHRRPPVDGVDYGFVGDVDRVDSDALSRLLDNGFTPVVAPLTHDGAGNMLNTNADTMASSVAVAMAPRFRVSLVYCFEKPGVLANADDDSSLIPTITRADFQHYVAIGTVSGGMLPKISNALNAVDHGVAQVVITRADDLPDISKGTKIVK